MTWVRVSEDGRQKDERFTDRALLLMAVGFGEKCGRLDEFRLMKIPFMVQYRLNQEHVKSFSYRFYRETYGPVSKAIYEDRDMLMGAGLLEADPESRRLTAWGKKLFAVLRKELKGHGENDHVVGVIKEKAEKTCKESGWKRIKNEIYSLPVTVPNQGTITIEQAEQYTDVLFKLPAKSAKGSITLPQPAKDALSFALSLTPSDLEASSIDSGLTLEEVFAI
jgi:hypothetical protein